MPLTDHGAVSRRRILAFAALAPAVAVASRAAAAETCGDPASLPAAQKSMRKALGFRPVSDQAGKTCGNCAFFTAKAKECGACALLSGGTVPAAGLCNSYAKKG